MRNGRKQDLPNDNAEGVLGFSSVIRNVYGAQRTFGGWGPRLKL